MKDAQLATLYTVAESTIRRWRRAGVITDTQAPLHDPVAMPDWWSKMMALGEFEKGCPATVEAAATRTAAAMPRDARDGADTVVDAELSALLATIQGTGVPDYSDGIKTAQRSVLVADYLLLRALAHDDEKKIGPLQKRLGEAQEVLRGLQRDRGKIESEAGDTLPKHEVRVAMMELHSNIQKRFRQGIRAAFPEAAELTESREHWNVFSDSLVDRICKTLTESDFAAP